MTTALTDAQVAVVQALAADAPGPNWLCLVADAVLRGADGALSDPSLSVSEPVRRVIVDLYRQRKDIAGEPFSGFELRIDNERHL